jgi:ABC-2 type transport system ATP-binding protein
VAERAATAAPLLEIRGLTKRWPRAAAPVLHDLALDVPTGSLTVVEGANGAGKTTLLRIIAGLLLADAGAIRLAGVPVGRTGYQRELGLASAGNAGLYARLNAVQHLSFAARIGLVPRQRRAQLIERALARFELSEFARRRVDRISMGQRQRLRLAMAFLHEPGVVLLDEPTTSLDPGGRALLGDAVTHQLAEGRAVLWCGPSAEPTGVGAERRLVLEAGALRA